MRRAKRTRSAADRRGRHSAGLQACVRRLLAALKGCATLQASMSVSERIWITAGLPSGAYEALAREPPAVVRLATSHRCVRAQEIPKVRGFTAHFRIFCLAAAGLERGNHAFVVGAIAEQISVMIDALERLERHGFAFPEKRITVLASEAKAALGDRIAEKVGRPRIARGVLDHQYYDGLRFQIAARSTDGVDVPLIDGGAFDWVARLASNNKAVFIATGAGSQLVPLLFRQSGSDS